MKTNNNAARMARVEFTRRLFVWGGSLRFAAALLGLLMVAVAHTAEPNTSQLSRFSIAAPATQPGQSVTLLPDGRWLFVGGEPSSVAAATVFTKSSSEASSAKLPPVSAALIHPRSAHTATVLPDGTVLILGGVDANGTTVTAAEILDPVSGEITVVGDSGLIPRSHHAATLLTDGYVLITGGVSSEGKALQDAELWNPDTQRVEPISKTMLVPRADHSAALLSDGKGLIWGGRDGSGGPLVDGEIYDPSSTLFSGVNSSDPSLPSPALRDAAPAMEASIPEANATDAPVDGRIAIRFSKHLQVRSVTNRTVTLVGPAGAVTGKVIAAGDGLLVFFTPQTQLLPNATYTVFLRGLADAKSQDLPWSAFKFTTRSLSATVASGGGDSITIDTPSAEEPSSAPPAVKRSVSDRKEEDRKRADQEQKPKADADDDFEDWIPGEHHRHGQWRVLGTRNEPRTSKAILRAAPLQVAAMTATGVSGRVARLNGLPIAGVAVRAGNMSTLTDAQGRFILSGLRAGMHEITVDGSAVTSGGRRYATHFIRVEVAPKRATVLDQPIYLARLNPANDVAIPSPADKDLVITHPDIPGLELHIPKGAVLRARDGRILTKLNITPLPVDRVPFSVPEGFPVYFTIQPAGAFIDGSATGTAAGIRVIYPNYLNAPAGTRMTFWNYDPSGLGWQVYGRGTVSENGQQVVPDADVVQRNFMAFGYAFDNPDGAADGPPPGGDCQKGDPVDCATGLFIHQVTDLYIADTIPLVMTRIYRPKDTRSRDFGIGANHSYGMFLSNPTNNLTGVPYGVDLVLPDGGRVRFALRSGATLGEAVYQHLNSPTPWMSATLRINEPADQFEITTRDKTVYSFTAHSPNVLTGIRDRYGNTVKVIRATEGGNIAQVISPNGRTLNFEYDASNRITRIRDNLGRVVKYQYDAQGRLWKATDPDNKVERYEYDSQHRMTAVIDKRGNTMVTNVYDSNGRVSQQTLADGAIWGFSYALNAFGKVTTTTVTNPRGYVSQMTFNTGGYVTQIIDAVGQPEQQTYTLTRLASNLRISVTDPLGRVTRFGFDHLGNVTHVTRLSGTPDAVSAAFTYDPVFSNLTSFTDALGHTTLLSHDALGNLTSVADPLSHTVTASYNDQGRLQSVTNALGKTASMDYEIGDAFTITDPLSRTTTLLSDAIGRTIGQLDPAGNRSQYDYDPLDRVLRLVDPRGGVTTMTYDENGNPRTVRDPRDLASHEFTYDVRDRVETYTDPLGNAESYDYDGMGNLTSMTDRKAQTTSYTYDALDRLKTLTYADGSSITLVWDAGNRPRQIIDTANGTITHDYDNLDRLTREVTPQGQVDYQYDDADRRTQLTVAGQAPITYDYDDASRLTRIAQGSVTIDLTYDASDRRATVTWPNGVVGKYGFDDADQLLSIVYDKGMTRIGEVGYTYDLAGQRIGQSGSLAKLTMPVTMNAATYDDANRLTNWAGQSLTYDDNGNLTSRGAISYAWNARDELISTSSGLSSFAYDALGRRRSRTVAGSTVSYLHDGMNPVLVNNELMLSGFSLDEFYARVSGGSVASLLPDALGSTRVLTDGIGNATASYGYTPYGEASRSGTSDTLFQFTGRENDGASGLNYYRARYYDPRLGRFIQSDPIGLNGGLNTYAYVNGDPVTLTDPTGEFAVVGALIGAGLEYLTNPCATASDLLIAGALGAVGGGISAKVFLRFGPRSLTRVTGKEWSHSISEKVVNRYTSGWLNRLLNRRGGINGSWTSPKRHYKHDPNRWPKGWRDFGERYIPEIRALDRVPDWLKGDIAAGGAGAAIAGCGCQ